MSHEQPSLYLIVFRSDRYRNIHVGALGEVEISPGYYVYIGSAKKNLTKRLKRHRKRQKPHRWHIDYLRPFLVWKYSLHFAGKEGECALVTAFRAFTGAEPVHQGLGSSDCKCDAHFLKLAEKEPAQWYLAGFQERWNAMGAAAFITNDQD